MPHRLNLHFPFDEAIPFQKRMDHCIKSLKQGKRTPFLINLCDALFGHLNDHECIEAMAKIAQEDKEAMREILSAACSKLNGESPTKSVVIKPVSPVPEDDTSEMFV